MAHRCNHCQSTCVGNRASEPQPSPDIARLMETNDCPSESQEEEFRAVRADGVQRLAELEAIIGELQQTLEGVMAERDALAWKVEHHRLVLNPVRRLPTDVLHEIFLFVCARSTEHPSHFCTIPPIRLAAVCRSWNTVAVAFPQLWRQCRFVLPSKCDYYQCSYYHNPNDPTPYTAENAYWLSGVCISRSAQCPLWLDLRLDDQLSYSNLAYPYLMSISSRIQRLRIVATDPTLLQSPLFRHFANGLTTMAEMDLSASVTRHTALAALSFPRTVRHLVVTPYDVFSTPTIDFNWSLLESLVLRAGYLGKETVSIRATLLILQKVPRLRRLTFSADWDGGNVNGQNGASATGDLIIIAHFTDLVIEACSQSVYGVLDRISTPSLESLFIRGHSFEILPHVDDMLRKSGCTLQHLTLHSIGHGRSAVESISAIDSLVRRCASVRELSLLCIRRGVDSITQLLASLQSLPQLRVLALDISYVHGLPASTIADDIVAFLESRRGPATTSSTVDLESFTLHAPDEEVFGFTDVQRQRVEALRASGLQFYVCRYAEKDPRMY